MRSLSIAQPHGAATTDLEEALAIADDIGFPVLVRPSYVLGGRAMEIVHSRDALQRYLEAAMAALPADTGRRRGTVLIDQYLFGTEVDVDAISDGETVVIPGLMEHVERAGVHSGDSMAAYPARRSTTRCARCIVDATIRIARALDVRGLCNIQFVVHRGIPHVLEVNPRASRTVPFLSKVTGVPMVELATRVMRGATLAELGWTTGLVAARPLVAVKAPVFSTVKLIDVDTALGPEMKSTGEVMGIDTDLGAALEKAFVAALGEMPTSGGVLCSIADVDKAEALPIIAQLSSLGFTIYATAGTAAALASAGISAVSVGKIGHGRPNVIDVIEDGRVSIVLNTVSNFGTDELDFSGDGRRGRGGRPHREGRVPHQARRRAASHPLLHVARHRGGARRRHRPPHLGKERSRRHRARVSRRPRAGGHVTADLSRAALETGEVLVVERLGGGLLELVARLPHLAATAMPGSFAQLRCGIAERRRCCAARSASRGPRTTPAVSSSRRSARAPVCSSELQPGDPLDSLGPLGHGFTLVEQRVGGLRVGRSRMRTLSAADQRAAPPRC